MKLDTAIAKKNRAILVLQNAYSAARLYHFTNEELIKRVEEIRSTYLAKCPSWAHAEFEGYRRALNDFLYANHLVFGGYLDGIFYSTHRNRPDYYGYNGIEPSEYADNALVQNRGHYWADDTTKPFFIS